MKKSISTVKSFNQSFENKSEIEYQLWISNLKTRILEVRYKTLQQVNQELIMLYWDIGHSILEQQNQYSWGAKIIDNLATDLKTLFPDMKGFSIRNLKYMRAFSDAWKEKQFVQEVLAQISWYHNLTLLDKVKHNEIRVWYCQQAIENGWSRNTMVHQIENGLYERQIKTKKITNFQHKLPLPESDLAQALIKDPYIFDFLKLDADISELKLKSKLLSNITRFLLELGKGFAYIGSEVKFVVNNDEFYIDLLFYHTRLHCYIVIELKTGKFKPDYAGQLNFYITLVDNNLKKNDDKPTIGLLLCKEKNHLVAEYALTGINQPMGIAEYSLTKWIPKDIESDLPSPEEIETLIYSK